jgi:nucleotide-binding universal stress UspA family protein
MAFRTVSLILFAGADFDSAAGYAIGLARRSGARLRCAAAIPPLMVPTLAYAGYSAATQMLMLVEQENLARRQEAEAKANAIRAEAEAAGVATDVEVWSAPYDPPTPHLLRLARLSDICVLAAPAPEPSRQREYLIDLLFGAAAPLLLVPPGWRERTHVAKPIVAWDGGRMAARAVRDALPLLAEAEVVEVASVRGEKGVEDSFGADLAEYLAGHCRTLSRRILPQHVDGAAAALAEHARLSGADLLVMGAYGHSRLREFILGGATRDMLAQIAIPTLMSH